MVPTWSWRSKVKDGTDTPMTTPRGHTRPFNRGRWAVERERCLIGDATPPPDFRDPSGIAEVLPSVLKQFGVEHTIWTERLTAEWPNIVGEAIARHARPGRLDGDTLRIFVTDNVWLHELKRFGPKTLVEKIRNATGISAVRRIQFELDPDSNSGR